MPNITRFEPFTDLARFGDDFFKDFMLRPIFRGLDMEPQIRLDVAEDDGAYTVKAEIPGANKDDIKVSVDGNQVSISAEMKKESEEKSGRKLVRSERYYGSVARTFTLAQPVDEAAAQAHYADGVLELTLPKKVGASSKHIPIS